MLEGAGETGLYRKFFDPAVEKAAVLEQEELAARIHFVWAYPFPFRNRDGIVAYRGERLSDGAFLLSWRDAARPGDPGTGVRIERIAGETRIKPLSPDRCRVTYAYLGDLGGSFPKSLEKKAWRREPLGYVLAIRRALALPIPPKNEVALGIVGALEHKVVDFLIQLAVILFAISFHESAHALAALKFGDTTARDLGRISLNPMRHIDPVGSILVPIVLYIFSGLIFGAAKPTPVDLRKTKNPRLANLVVSAAGPLSNFLLAACGILLFAVIRRVDPQVMQDLFEALRSNRFAGGALAPLAYILYFFVMVNVMLGVFNLLPIPPLDGSGVVLSLVGPPAARVYATLAPFGFLILILLIATPVLRNLFYPIQTITFRLIFGA